MVFVGEEELGGGGVRVRDFVGGRETVVARDELAAYLRESVVPPPSPAGAL